MLQGLLRVPSFIKWLSAGGEPPMCQALVGLHNTTVQGGQDGSIVQLLHILLNDPDTRHATNMDVRSRQSPSQLHLVPGEPAQAFSGLLTVLEDKVSCTGMLTLSSHACQLTGHGAGPLGSARQAKSHVHCSSTATGARPRPRCSCLRPAGSRKAWHAFPGVQLGGMPGNRPCSSPYRSSQCCHSDSALLLQKRGEAADKLRRLAGFRTAFMYTCKHPYCKATRGDTQEEYLIDLNLGTMQHCDSVAQGLMVSSVSDLNCGVQVHAAAHAVRGLRLLLGDD